MNTFENYKTFVMVGRPGSGKGVQSKFLAEKTGFKVFSSGDKFRMLRQEDSFIGKKIRGTVDRGGLMPYWFAGFLFQEVVIYLPHEEGIIFEGSARKAPEAVLFHDVMEWLERPYKAIYLDVSDDISVTRLLKRKEIENRDDDVEDRIRVRLSFHKKEVEPAMDVFRSKGTLLHVNGDQTPEKVFEEILEKLSHT